MQVWCLCSDPVCHTHTLSWCVVLCCAVLCRRGEWDPEQAVLSWHAAVQFCAMIKQLRDQGYEVGAAAAAVATASPPPLRLRLALGWSDAYGHALRLTVLLLA
jgi:hypothetical protein